MLTLSLREPWLSQLFDPVDAKRIENRTWLRHVQGKAVLLHAAKQMDPDEYHLAAVEMRAYGVKLPVLERRRLRQGHGIVGVARVTHILGPHQEHLVEHLQLPWEIARWWRRSAYGYVLDDVAEFHRPIKADGYPGFYETAQALVQCELDAVGWRLTDADIALERAARPVQATLEALLGGPAATDDPKG